MNNAPEKHVDQYIYKKKVELSLKDLSGQQKVHAFKFRVRDSVRKKNSVITNTFSVISIRPFLVDFNRTRFT